MSITLTKPKKVDVNGVNQENNTQGATVAMNVDFLSNTVTFKLHIGTVQGTPPNLNIGVYSTPPDGGLTVVVDLATGKFTVQETGQTGTVPSGPLNTFISEFKADRNQSETLATLGGAAAIMPGTQVPWT